MFAADSKNHGLLTDSADVRSEKGFGCEPVEQIVCHITSEQAEDDTLQ